MQSLRSFITTSPPFEKDNGREKPNLIDAHVGSRVRLRHMLLGMSQEHLCNRMGLTFQQVQEYAKGANRIGASRLYHISKILDAPVGFFFEEAPWVEGQSVTPVMAEAESEVFILILELLNTREGLELIRSFTKIADAKIRKSVVDLVRTLSEMAKTK